MIEWMGPIVAEYYGGTETGPVTYCTSEEWLEHPGSVGRALPGAVVKIFDEAGQELPPGRSGEVYMWHSAWPDFTYEGDDEKRRSVERDGLVSCGDIGYIDEDGYLYLNDRASDMVISGGVNIYPAEIEACLLSLPGVTRLCGVRDPRRRVRGGAGGARGTPRGHAAERGARCAHTCASAWPPTRRPAWSSSATRFRARTRARSSSAGCATPYWEGRERAI